MEIVYAKHGISVPYERSFKYVKDTFRLPWQYLPQPNGRICDERYD